MKPARILAVFDSHTPYLSFRLNALHRAIEAKGLTERLQLHVVLIGAEEASYGWDHQGLQSLYRAPITVLSNRFRGLGLRTFLDPSVPRCLWKLTCLLFKLRPKVTFVGGYDRPESILTTLLSRLWGGKTGVWNDSKFSDSESFGKRMGMEMLKSLIVGRYHFFLCPGRDSLDYHQFLGGAKKPAFTHSWDVVDNEAIAQQAETRHHDAAIRDTLKITGDFFLMPVRFVPKKNLDRVIEAYARYHQACGGDVLPLVICGKGPEEARLRQNIATHQLEDVVHVVPWLPYEHVPRACRLSRAVLLASTHDQWGMIVNEALAAGAPVLVSNRCGAHELVRNHVNGYTFDPYDSEHLSQLFEVMSRDDSLVERLRAEASPSMQRFSIDQWLTRHFAVLEHFGVLTEHDLHSRPLIAETRATS